MGRQAQRPFVWMAWGSIFGILLGNAFQSTRWMALLLAALCALAFFIYFKWAKGMPLLLLMLSCMFFFVRFHQVDESNVSQLDRWVKEEEERLVRGTILSFPEMDGDRLSFDCQIEQLYKDKKIFAIRERVRVTVRLTRQREQQQAQTLLRGDQIQTRMRFIKPQPARNPGGFDYRKFLYQQRIHWLGEVESFEQIRLRPGEQWDLFRLLNQLRQHFAARITNLYSAPYDGYVRGLLLGEREQLDPQLEEAYIAYGIMHVLSISGLHFSILVSLSYFLLTALGLSREKASLIIIILLPCYTLLTGADPPVVRAGIMAGLLLLANILNRWKDAQSFLALACLCQLLWNPYLLFMASFQLTYVITAALIVGVPPLIKQETGVWRRLKQALVIALVAQFASFPIVIRFFYEFTFLAWLANLLFVPFLSALVLPGAMIALGISFFSSDISAYIAQFTVWVIDGVHYSMKWLSPLFDSASSWQPPSLFWLVLYSGASCYLWFSLVQERYRPLLHRLVASMLFMGTLLLAAFPLNSSNETRVTFLDVGQGDCIVIETGQGKTIIIDGGGTPFVTKAAWQRRRDPFEVGKKVVIPYLKYRGIRQIDTLVITHGDADHIGGLQAVLSRFPVRQVIRNSLPPKSDLEKALMFKLAHQGVPIYTAALGVMQPIEDGVYWQFLHPPREINVDVENSTNNESVVILFTIYGHRLLLTGDIEQTVEDELIRHWNLPIVDVLKVAHHGSKTSTSEEWLKQTAPKEAVISVGRKNRYGHPAPTVLRRLRKHRVRIWRTDRHGAITMLFRPAHYQVKSMLQNSGQEMR